MIRILDNVLSKTELKTERLKGGYRRRDIGHYTLHMNYGPKAVKIKASVLKAGDIWLINNKAQKAYF